MGRSRHIVIRGARQHNLKNIDVIIPRDKLVVITGLSGSGKSTLAIDTLYAEGQRRYVESLSSYARQFLDRMEKPDVDSIVGLSPAISIDQKGVGKNPRSTVGTVTELYDYLRLLFAKIGRPYCRGCGREIVSHSIQQAADRIMAFPKGTRVHVLAPLVRKQRGSFRHQLRSLLRKGFTRAVIDGRLHELGEVMELDSGSRHDIDVLVDRLVMRSGLRGRLTDSLEVASKLTDGLIKVSTDRGELLFSQRAVCIDCGVSVHEISPRLFSFNSPYGACPSCKGTGAKAVEEPHRRDETALDRSTEPCPCCRGSRLRPEALSVKIEGLSIAEMASMPIRKLASRLEGLRLDGRDREVASRILKELIDRLSFMGRVGVEYLSLDRPVSSLSAGEAQRIRLATQLGANLAGVLYILDEPSVGLHARDNARLLETLIELRDQGNTVLVVEHDPLAILSSDHVIDMGPGAGEAGGEVVFSGPPGRLKRDQRSLTGGYLSGRLCIPVPVERRPSRGRFLHIKGASHNNLKGIDVQIPLGCFTCVTGVSGSGKSTLVIDTLYRWLARKLYNKNERPGSVKDIEGFEYIEHVIDIDQAPIGRSPRSNPATYTGIFKHLREILAMVPEARIRGYRPSRFSFNMPGGRCEGCSGEGMVKVEMHFLPDVYVTCEQCRGRRYNRETLEIMYKGRNIAEILDMTVDQAFGFFRNIPPISQRLQCLREVGLGYIRLGQPATTLSGGEAQRVKLSRELAKRRTGRTLYILDEPTTGLHFADVQRLLEVLNRLVEAGNTVVVIEHNLDVIKAADFVIDLGPEGGEEGGRVVASGTPEELSEVPGSHTGRYLKKLLSSKNQRQESQRG